MDPYYRICVFGNIQGFREWEAKLVNEISNQLGEFDMRLHNEVSLLIEPEQVDNLQVSTVGLFWGGDPIPNFERPKNFAEHYPIIPIVSNENKTWEELPEEIAVYSAIGTNAAESEVTITAAILECLGILPSQRRIFLSYRRIEASAIALQLFIYLSKRQFKVFLDTHEIRPSTKFQEHLRHQLSDSDIMIMLDTKGYFESEWTVEEFTEANNMNVGILRVKFPDSEFKRIDSLGDPIEINESNIKNDKTLSDEVVDSIMAEVEKSRSISVGRRTRKMCRKVLRLESKTRQRKSPLFSGNFHEMRVNYRGKGTECIYPSIVVPNSELIHKISKVAKSDEFLILYDDSNVTQNWVEHLDWLEEKIGKFSWLKISNVNQKHRGE